MAYTYNDNGTYIVGNKQHSDEWLPIEKDENGVITAPLGLVEQIANEQAGQKLQEAKQQKLTDLANITVTTTSGKTFDGRDIDQTRMMAAIQAADILGQTETEWKLADNSIVTVTVDEVKEALALAIQKTGEIIKG